METKKKTPDTPEPTTSDLRVMLKELLMAELEDTEKLLSKCTLEQRVVLFNKLGALLIPRLTEEEAKELEKMVENEGIQHVSFTVDDSGIASEKPEPLRSSVKKRVDELLKKAGRPKGALNKKNRDARVRWKKIFVSEFKYIKERLDDLAPDKRLDFLLKISLLVIPRETVKSLNHKEQQQFGATIMDYNNGKAPSVSLYDKRRVG